MRREWADSPRWWVFVFVSLLVGGCATTKPEFTYELTPSDANLVWPQPPEVPRFRYVGQLTGEDNFQRERIEESAPVRFLKWVAGVFTGPRQPIILQRPQGVAVDSAGRVIVSDVSRQAVCVFDPLEGEFKVYEFATDSLRFQAPIGVAVDDAGDIFVADSAHKEVFRLGPAGEPRGRFGKDILGHPTGIARDPGSGRLFVSDTWAHAIKVFEPDGKFVHQFGERGEQPGQLNSPTYLSFGGGQLLVSDTLNSRVQIFTPAGEFVATFGERGLFVGNLPRPKGVAAAENGLIYVVESYYDHLLVFNSKGEFLLPIGGEGSAPGQFYLPAGVSVDSRNRVYIADMFNGRVVVLEYLRQGGEA